jgi:hypothetical protein
VQESIVADERQEKITRLSLILAGVDGIIALLTVVIPLKILGEKAFTDRIAMFVIPCCTGIAITLIFFVYGMMKIEKT